MDKLIEALKLIKVECISHNICDDKCPMYCAGDCLVRETDPSRWNLQEKPIMKILIRED